MDFTALDQENNTTWTQAFTAIYGSYDWLNGVPIHYFTTSLSVLNLHDDVRLMGEIVGVEKWGFEALFQRVVREEWVKQMVRGYLENENRFKFFPPVTIALLPCEGDAPQRDYGGKSFEFKRVNEGAGSGYKCMLEGLEILLPFAKGESFPPFGTPVQLKWDQQRYAALAIDGQHRIKALRDHIPRTSQTAASRDVPATIIVFDTKLPRGRDLIQATREIFIDINRNAKTVDASRLILLDDRNFYNGLTRRLILPAYKDGENPSPIEFDRADDGIEFEVTAGIPQELIDTAAGKEATDVLKLKNWQYVSAFILNKSLQYFVFENSFKRFEEIMDTGDYKEDSDEEHERIVAEVRARLDDDEDPITDKDDLTFEPLVAEKLVERAVARYGSLLLGAFTGFKPYKEHIQRFKKEIEAEGGDRLRSILLSEGSIPKSVSIDRFNTKMWLDLEDCERRAYAMRIKKLFRPDGWEKSIVWFSVFQRGLLFQPLGLRRCLAVGRGDDYGSRQEFATDFVRGLDVLHENGLFLRDAEIEEERIWEGIVLKLGDGGDRAMDGGDAAAKRCGNLIRLLIAAIFSGERNGYNEFENNLERRQGVKGAFTNACNGYAKFSKTREAAGGITREPEEYSKEARDRLKKILAGVADVCT